jgi:hypothetical protein
MSGAPDIVHGAWARQSASIGGGPRFETQLVVWLQAGTCYADIRTPLHPDAAERCFTGRSFWDGDSYRWTHHLDLDVGSPAADDFGDLRMEDGALIETGMFPTADGSVPYEEVWVPLARSTGPWLAMEAERGCLVRVGDHAITVLDERGTGGGFTACYRILGDDGWVVVATVGSDARADALPRPDDLPTDWRVIHTGNAPEHDAQLASP